MSSVIKHTCYRETNLINNGVRVLRSTNREQVSRERRGEPLGLTLEEWQSRIDRMRDEAETEAQKIIEAAEKQSEKILKESKVAGYEQGYNAGLAEGRQKGQQEAVRRVEGEWSQRLKVLDNLLKALESEVVHASERVLEASEDQVVELAFAIASRILIEEIDRDDDVVIRTVKECLDKASSPSKVKVRVSGRDLGTMAGARDEITSRFDTLESVELVDDPAVEPGGCLIETDNGSFDGRITRQLEQAMAAVKAGAHNGNGGF